MKNWAILFLLIMSRLSFGQSIDTTYIQHYFDSLTSEHQFSGQVLVGKGSEVIFLKSFGKANYSLNQEFNDSTRFQIASLSKQFTASAILLLQERGKLHIDSSFAFYYPTFPYKNITLRQLLNHTSGLPEFYPMMTNEMDTTIVNGNQIMIEMLLSGKYELEFQPGSKWLYCNISYCLLASLIEHISNQSFSAFLKDNLFTPANMNATTAELVTDIRNIKGKNLALGYSYNDTTQTFIRAEEIPSFNYVYWLGGFYGDGSVVTSITDLFRWKKSLGQGYPISKEILNQLIEPQTLNNGQPNIGWGTVYGLGWYILPERFGFKGKAIEHAGVQPGFRSRMTIALEEDITIIILANLEIDKFWKKRILPKSLINH